MDLFTVLFFWVLYSFMGGEIVAQHDGGNDYLILLTLYRYTGNSNELNTNFDVYDASGNTGTSIVSNLDPTAFHPVFDCLREVCFHFIPMELKCIFSRVPLLCQVQ